MPDAIFGSVVHTPTRIGVGKSAGHSGAYGSCTDSRRQPPHVTDATSGDVTQQPLSHREPLAIGAPNNRTGQNSCNTTAALHCTAPKRAQRSAARASILQCGPRREVGWVLGTALPACGSRRRASRVAARTPAALRTGSVESSSVPKVPLSASTIARLRPCGLRLRVPPAMEPWLP
jgi:hypothetical protein